MSMIQRMGGLSVHVKHDSQEIAARARRGLEERFRREALEQSPTLTGERLEKKIDLIRRLYFTRMAHERERKRAARKKGGGGNG